jgi:hypothetical protein
LKQLTKLVAISGAAIACGLASLPAQAQTYTGGSTAPSWTTILSTTLTTTASSAKEEQPGTLYYGLSLYNSAYAAYGYNNYSVNGFGTTAYATATFAETAGLYNVSESYTGYTAGTLDEDLYDGTFTPGSARTSSTSSLTNLYSIEEADGTSSDYQVLLPAKTTGAIVDTDIVPTGYTEGGSPIVVNGSDVVKVSELNATIIPTASATGASVSLTDTGSGVIGSTTTLSSLSIFGLNSTYDGDLVGTLTHDGTTIDIFDQAGASSANYNTGSWGVMSNTAAVGSIAASTNVYTFADSGASLGAITAGNSVAGGTYALSGGANGDASLFEAFDGDSEAGTWTLNIANVQAGDLAYFTGFAINLTPTPEASTYVSMLLATCFALMLVWKARRNRFGVTALEGDDNE